MSDIYSLGMIILEITTRERNYSASEDKSARQFVDNVRALLLDDLNFETSVLESFPGFS
jgi:disease resistance protein RPM1